MLNQIIVRKVFSNIPALVDTSNLAQICQKIVDIKPHSFHHCSLEFTLRTIKWFYPLYPNEKARYIALEPEIVETISQYLLMFSAKTNELKSAFNAQNKKMLEEHVRKQYETFQQQIANAEKTYTNELKRVRDLVIQIRNGSILQSQIIERLSKDLKKSFKNTFDLIEEHVESLQKKLKLLNYLKENKILYINVQDNSIQQNDDLNAVFRKLNIKGKSQLIFCSRDYSKEEGSTEWDEQHDKWKEEGETDPSLTLVFADFTDAKYRLSKVDILRIELTNDNDNRKQSKSSSSSCQTTDNPSLSVSNKLNTKEEESSESPMLSAPTIVPQPTNQPEKTEESSCSLQSSFQQTAENISTDTKQNNNVEKQSDLSNSTTKPVPSKRRKSITSIETHQLSQSEHIRSSNEQCNTMQPPMILAPLISPRGKYASSNERTPIASKPLYSSSTEERSSVTEQVHRSSVHREISNVLPSPTSRAPQVSKKQPKDNAEKFHSSDVSTPLRPSTAPTPTAKFRQTEKLPPPPKLEKVLDERRASQESRRTKNDHRIQRQNSAPVSSADTHHASVQLNGYGKESTGMFHVFNQSDTKNRSVLRSGIVSLDESIAPLPSPRSSPSHSASRSRRLLERSTKQADNTSNSPKTLSPPAARGVEVKVAWTEGSSQSSSENQSPALENQFTDSAGQNNQSVRKESTGEKHTVKHNKESEQEKVQTESSLMISEELTNTENKTSLKRKINDDEIQEELSTSTHKKPVQDESTRSLQQEPSDNETQEQTIDTEHAIPSKNNLNNDEHHAKLQPLPVEYNNVLLLGESGVGKSTFINALVNYYAFENFEQARSGKPLVAMPVSFLMTIGDYFEEKIVRFGGIDPNENHDHPGQSVTQHCRSYVFKIGTQTKLRLIDTPGMGDTRGLEQDDMNMEHILSFITNLPHLNAICILLKPNESRLNVVLRSYFTRLLNFLGENARNNIVFCFTNTRSTFFVPGNTGPLLRKMINDLPTKGIPFAKANTFCFDSEAFRYLVALQNGIKFDTYQEKEYEQSWASSSATSMQFIQYISQLQPYEQRTWQSIEHAQFAINQLVRPMLESIRNILRNITIFKEKTSNLIIQLRPVVVDKPSSICYQCSRVPKRFLDFWILPDDLHIPSDTVSCCGCIRRRHDDVSYSVTYEIAHSESEQSFEKMRSDLNQLRQAIVEIAQFYPHIVDTSKQDDPLLSALKRITNEEKQICAEKGAQCLNSTLYNLFVGLTAEYKERQVQVVSKKPSLDLLRIYKLIEEISKVDQVKEQMNAIKRYQKKHLKQHEKQVS